MKKSVKYLILITSIFVFLSTKTNAQDRKFNFGIHFAPNVSWIKPDVDGGEAYKYEPDGARVLMGYGADFNYFFIPNIAIGTGINVVYNGGKLRYPTPYTVRDNYDNPLDTVQCNLYRKYKLQYLEIPIVIVGSTGDLMGNFSIYGKFGIGSGFKLKARADDEFKEIASEKSYIKKNTNIGHDVSFFKESLIIGLGGTYKFKKIISLNFGVNYDGGFTDILRSENAGSTEQKKIEENAKASYLELYVGILF